MINTKPLTVVFCLPGETFSTQFLQNWTQLIMELPRYNIQPRVSPAESSNVYFVRSKCLGGDVLLGVEQKPFRGEPYDYIMWIDSDSYFRPELFFQLLSHKADIVSGYYMMQGERNFAVVKDWDEEVFRTNGSFEFMTVESMAKEKELFEVAYAGMGFMLVKRGVFESLDYPWFAPVFHDMGGGVRDFSSEDVSFCLRAREKGFRVFVDPTVRVGHEKRIVI